MRIVILVVVAALALVGVNSIFVVDERQKAVMFRLGEMVRAEFDPGLYFKIPVIHNVRFFDRRVLTMDTPPERFLTSEKKNVIVDFFVKWRIDAADQFYRSTRGDEGIAIQRLQAIIKNGLRDEFGARTIQQAISGERVEIMDSVKRLANERTDELGIQIIDVRIKKIDLPQSVRTSVYQRMEKERATVAKSFRSRGEKEAKSIRADASRQREEILAEAYREAQVIRGNGDAKAAEIYALAFGKDEEFYNFYRSLGAYRQVFSQKEDLLILEPDSSFFRYFSDPRGGATPQQDLAGES